MHTAHSTTSTVKRWRKSNDRVREKEKRKKTFPRSPTSKDISFQSGVSPVTIFFFSNTAVGVVEGGRGWRGLMQQK